MAWRMSGPTTPKSKKLAQVTKFTDFDVKSLDAGAGAVVFEQAGYIHELDPKTGKAARGQHHRHRRFSVDDAALGRRHQPHDATWRSRRPASAWLVEARGEIFTIPAEKGDVRNLTQLERLGRARPRVVARRQVSSPTSATSRANTSWSSRRRTA